jgi:hypothetical protein
MGGRQDHERKKEQAEGGGSHGTRDYPEVPGRRGRRERRTEGTEEGREQGGTEKQRRTENNFFKEKKKALFNFVFLKKSFV